MASDKVILKLKHAGVYRRLQLHERPLTLREVNAFIGSALPGVGSGSYVLSYVDEEGDKVIVGTDMELAVATHSSAEGLILRLDVEPSEHKQNSNATTAPLNGNSSDVLNVNQFSFGCRKPRHPMRGMHFGRHSHPLHHNCNLNTNKTNNTNDNDAGYVHQAICDACQQQIRGVRYKCSVCADYDLCASCQQRANEHHPPTHSFTTITAASARCGVRRRWGWRGGACNVANLVKEMSVEDAAVAPPSHEMETEEKKESEVAVKIGENDISVVVAENENVTPNEKDGTSDGVGVVENVAESPQEDSQSQSTADQVRDILIGMGFDEEIVIGLVDAAEGNLEVALQMLLP